MRIQGKTVAAAAAIVVGATACGSDSGANPAAPPTVSESPDSPNLRAGAHSATPQSVDNGAQWVETYVDEPMTFSVAMTESPYSPIDPGMWASTARNPDPNKLVPCRSWQWAGENRQDIVGVFGTPIGESKLQFTIENVPGHIELSGDCDWSGGWDG